MNGDQEWVKGHYRKTPSGGHTWVDGHYRTTNKSGHGQLYRHKGRQRKKSSWLDIFSRINDIVSSPQTRRQGKKYLVPCIILLIISIVLLLIVCSIQTSTAVVILALGGGILLGMLELEKNYSMELSLIISSVCMIIMCLICLYLAV